MLTDRAGCSACADNAISALMDPNDSIELTKGAPA